MEFTLVTLQTVRVVYSFTQQALLVASSILCHMPGTGSAEISPACKEVISIMCRINGSYILGAQREAAYVGPSGKASRRR